MIKTTIKTGLMAVALLITTTAVAQDKVEQLFTDLQTSIENKKEKQFKNLWNARAWEHNLSGESGLSGQQAYKQAIKNDWKLQPEMEMKLIRVETYIVPVNITGEEAKLYTAVVPAGEDYVILGMAKDLVDIEIMLKKYVNDIELKPYKADAKN